MGKYSERHGGPYDRGSADSYYRRPFDPHYYDRGTGDGPRRVAKEGTEEYEAYKSGYYYQELCNDHKEWGD